MTHNIHPEADAEFTEAIEVLDDVHAAPPGCSIPANKAEDRPSKPSHVHSLVESCLFEADLLSGHEPGIPRGETPLSTAGGTPAATEARFMGSPLFKKDLLTGHEPGIPRGETPLSTAGGTPAATEARFMGSATAA
jgi:hypothetical protein